MTIYHTFFITYQKTKYVVLTEAKADRNKNIVVNFEKTSIVNLSEVSEVNDSNPYQETYNKIKAIITRLAKSHNWGRDCHIVEEL